MRRSLAVAGALVLLLLPAVAFGAPSEFEELRSKGWLWAYLGVFAAGVLTPLTPCGFPLIGITLRGFCARGPRARPRGVWGGAVLVLWLGGGVLGRGGVFLQSGAPV